MYRLNGLGAVAPNTALANASAAYGVPLPLLTAVATKESGLNPNATGTSGEQGLMQIMPANFASLGVTNGYDTQQSANAGAQLLSKLYAQYGDWNTALIAYNEGSGNLASKGIFPVSQSYADSILQAAGPFGAPTNPVASDPSGGSVIDASSLFDVTADGSAPSSTFPFGTVAIGLGIAFVIWAVNR